MLHWYMQRYTVYTMIVSAVLSTRTWCGFDSITPEGVILVLCSFERSWDVVTVANVLQHAQDGFIGTPMSRAPECCDA